MRTSCRSSSEITLPEDDVPFPVTGRDADHVELGARGRAGGAVPHLEDGCLPEGAVGETESDRQLVVVTGCAHRCGDEVVVQADLHRILDDDVIRHAVPHSGAGCVPV